MSGPIGDGWVRVFAPATISNVGPGFDAFGFALDTPGDIVAVRAVDAPGVRIVGIDGDDGQLPLETERNTAGVAAQTLWGRVGDAGRGLEVYVEKGLPPCSGLGSSAASAVAAAEATMQVAVRDTGAERDEVGVLESALAGEAVASGSIHADNVAPSLLGGFTIVQSVEPPVIARFTPVLAPFVTVVTPNISIATEMARGVLPTHVTLADAVANWSNAAAVVLGFATGDEDLVARSFTDRVVEPHRACLIPGFDDVREAALGAGAYASTISGSGPTMFALATTADTAAATRTAMEAVFGELGLECRGLVTRLAATGARVIA